MGIVRKIIFAGIFILSFPILAQDRWEQLLYPKPIFEGTSFNHVVKDYNNVLYAVDTEAKIYRSTDWGKNWTLVYQAYSGIQNFIVGLNNELFIQLNRAVYSSNDRGETWSKRLSTGSSSNVSLKELNGSVYCLNYRSIYKYDYIEGDWNTITRDIPGDGSDDFTICPDGTLFALSRYIMNNAPDPFKINRYDESSQKWVSINPPVDSLQYCFFIESSENSRLWFGGREGLFYSDDRGENWVNAMVNNYNIDFSTSRFQIMDDNVIIVPYNYSSIISYDNGETFQYLSIRDLNSAVLTEDGYIFATDNGLLKLMDFQISVFIGGSSYSNLSPNDVEYGKNGKIYFATDNGLYSSINNGEILDLEIKEFGGNEIRVDKISILDNDDIYVSASKRTSNNYYDYKIYYKLNNSESWQESDVSLRTLHFEKHPTGALFTPIYYYSGIYKSTDKGATWELAEGLENIRSNYVFVSNTGRIFINNIGHFANPAQTYGYYYSDDAGATWEYSALTRSSKMVAMIQLENSDLILSTTSGIYKSIDDGDSWTTLIDNTGRVNNETGNSMSIQSIDISKNNNILAANHGEILFSDATQSKWFQIHEFSVWYNMKLIVTPENHLLLYGPSDIFPLISSFTIDELLQEQIISYPDEFYLKQNYPNPFNLSTTISYTLAEKSFVELSIFNSLGEKVKTLINNRRSAGTHQMIWDGTNASGKTLPSGVYFYRLHTELFTETKKMILLK